MVNQDEMVNVFDFLTNSNDIADLSISSMLISAVAVLVGMVCLFMAISRKKASKPYRFYSNATFYILSFGVIILLMSTPIVLIDRRDFNELREIYQNNKYKVSQGIVHVLNEQSVHGHEKGDIVEVQGIRFEINYFVSTRAYIQTIAHGGVLTEGAYVRICHYDGKILRIDIPRQVNETVLRTFSGS